MKIFDSWSGNGFKKDDGGRTVFFPLGSLGSGYLLDSVVEERVRLFMGRAYGVGILVAIGLPIAAYLADATVLTILACLLVFLGIYIGAYSIGIKSLLRGVPKSDLKLSYEEAVKGTPAENQSMDGFSYWASVTGMSLAGIVSLYWGVSSGDTILIYCGIFFVLIPIVGLVGRAMIKKKS
jgi:hypothetical protein